MKILTSRRDLFICAISGFFLSIFFITNDYAQTPAQPTNQLSTINQQQRFIAANDKGFDVVDLTVKSTTIEAFAKLKPTDFEAAAFLLINEQREAKKIKPLKLDLGMLSIARAHSTEMAEFNYFSHKGRDGSMVDARATKAGIVDWQGVGENIAFNQNAEDQVQLAVQGWMNSAHHRGNLLNPTWTKSGIGIAVTSDHKFYITQVFRE